MAFKTPITVQRLTAVADEFGQVDASADSSWSSYTVRRCDVVSPSSREFRRDDHVTADTTHMLVMRWDPLSRRITPKMRVLWSDAGSLRLLHIEGVREDLKLRRVILTCKEEI